MHRASNGSHVTLGFIFESFANQTRACEPWCSAAAPHAQAEGFGVGVGEPAQGLTITYGQRTFPLPAKQE